MITQSTVAILWQQKADLATYIIISNSIYDQTGRSIIKLSLLIGLIRPQGVIISHFLAIPCYGN